MPDPHRPGPAAGAALEQALFVAADKLRSSMDAAEYKHVVLGLVCLRSLGGARWPALAAAADDPRIGASLDEAIAAIETERPELAGALTRRFAGLDPQRLGELVRLIDRAAPLAGEAARDVLGQVYEYFLMAFAGAEGKRGGQFYTPRCVVELLARLCAPLRGRVYDPCCGSGGMFVAGARAGDTCLFGQESNPTTWRLARMNRAIHGRRGDLGDAPADSFVRDLHPELRADVVLANPPFNDSDWRGEQLRDDPRWRFGAPPPGCANFAWVQHILYHLAPRGRAAVVLANGSLTARKSGEGEIRRAIVEADLVDAIVALPPQLFYATQIPACVWLLARDRPRRGHVLFIDARALGTMATRTHRILGDDLARIVAAYHAWRDGTTTVDDPGFCRAATLAEIAAQNFVLTPGRYVAEPPTTDHDEPPAARLARLARELDTLTNEGARLDGEIRQIVRGLGHAD
jgi:type I restriction enzyme M protein